MAYGLSLGVFGELPRNSIARVYRQGWRRLLLDMKRGLGLAGGVVFLNETTT